MVGTLQDVQGTGGQDTDWEEWTEEEDMEELRRES